MVDFEGSTSSIFRRPSFWPDRHVIAEHRLISPPRNVPLRTSHLRRSTLRAKPRDNPGQGRTPERQWISRLGRHSSSSTTKSSNFKNFKILRNHIFAIFRKLANFVAADGAEMMKLPLSKGEDFILDLSPMRQIEIPNFFQNWQFWKIEIKEAMSPTTTSPLHLGFLVPGRTGPGMTRKPRCKAITGPRRVGGGPMVI